MSPLHGASPLQSAAPLQGALPMPGAGPGGPLPGPPDWLLQLAPDHAPQAPGWWPPAPGWWLLALLGVAAVAVLVWWLMNRRGRGAMLMRLVWSPRRAALAELRAIRESDADPGTLAQGIQNLLRRYAVAAFGRDRVASLTGDAWLELVVSEGGEPLAGGPGRSLLAAAFGGRAPDDREQWLAGAEAFLRQAPRKQAPPRRTRPPGRLWGQPARGMR